VTVLGARDAAGFCPAGHSVRGFDDRGVELPANIKGEAARKVVDKLIRAGLLEEVGAAGSLPVWRRDNEGGPMALRITENGLEAIDVGGDAVGAPEKTSPGQSRSTCI
jgi:hypothetical protein